MKNTHIKIALVADWITHFWWAERVFLKLMKMYPEADIYTSVFFPTQELKKYFQGRKVYTSFIQHIPFLNRRHKFCMLLRPLAFRRFDFSGYDLVISSSSAEAKGVYTEGKTKHICYCHTPTRYLWSHSEQYKKFLEFWWMNVLAKLIIPTVFSIMRKWDYRAAQRPDILIANSINTQERIQKYYNRESKVVYPFFSSNEEWKISNELNKQNILNKWNVSYLVCLWRIVPYKRFDLAIDVCNTMNLSLKIFTNTKNAESERLQKFSWPTIEWIFDASDGEVARWLKWAKWFIMPQEEDFGIVALEAMSHGTPVIAYWKWWAVETVVDGKTGVLFYEQTSESLIWALEKINNITWDHDAIRKHSISFSEERFEEGIREVVEKLEII